MLCYTLCCFSNQHQGVGLGSKCRKVHVGALRSSGIQISALGAIGLCVCVLQAGKVMIVRFVRTSDPPVRSKGRDSNNTLFCMTGLSCSLHLPIVQCVSLPALCFQVRVCVCQQLTPIWRPMSTQTAYTVAHASASVSPSLCCLPFSFTISVLQMLLPPCLSFIHPRRHSSRCSLLAV